MKLFNMFNPIKIMETDVCTRAEAKKLKKAGFVQDSTFYWEVLFWRTIWESLKNWDDQYYWGIRPKENKVWGTWSGYSYSAFTSSELLGWVPPHIDIDLKLCRFRIDRHSGFWVVGYRQEREELTFEKSFQHKRLTGALVRLLEWLDEGDYLQTSHRAKYLLTKV